MFKTLPYLFILFISVQYGYSQAIIKSNEIIAVPKIDYGTSVTNAKFHKGKSTVYGLKFINENPNQLQILDMFTFWWDGALTNSRIIEEHKIINYDLNTSQYEIIKEGNSEPDIQNQLELQDSKTVIINDNPVPLNWEIPPIEGYSNSSVLVKAIQLPQKKIVAGIVYFSFHVSHYSNNRNLLMLWDRNTGMNLFQNQSNFVATSITSFSVEATKNEQYVYMRDMTQLIKTEEYNYLTPSVTLVDTETLEQIPADKDVAFTSNYQHYVTAVNNTPTLININTQKAIQHYDIDGKIMTAATFSPDYQQLYVATLSDDIYVFPSQLPTANIQNWDIYQ